VSPRKVIDMKFWAAIACVASPHGAAASFRLCVYMTSRGFGRRQVPTVLTTVPSGITYEHGTLKVLMQLHFVELATFLVRNSN